MPERNGWTIAERAGEWSPAATQRLLNRARWDTAGAMSMMRRFAVARLDTAAPPACSGYSPRECAGQVGQAFQPCSVITAWARSAISARAAAEAFCGPSVTARLQRLLQFIGGEDHVLGEFVPELIGKVTSEFRETILIVDDDIGRHAGESQLTAGGCIARMGPILEEQAADPGRQGRTVTPRTRRRRHRRTSQATGSAES
ncbi:hypothetical protein ACFPOI_37700 [Nonomuraea angiospora]|uniref:Transposase n=1 Tax=Nonomuraea angiospora TaxID=46172 RepID=A0ABR9M0Y0_9ACTN|nr:hypothetical protein [Nonomuraea angiospora]MBE1586538.1 hypothetical protein [Nonomuraea angiospora]